MSLDLTRHLELIDPHYFTENITVIGAGATGSWLVLQLAKLGLGNITVYDFDKIESHNIPNQAFGISDIGKYKAECIKSSVKAITGVEINAKNEKYTNQRLSGIVFLMVDSMAERKRIWEESIKMKSAIKLLVEPRMGLDVGRIYNVNPIDLNDIKEYEKTYYGDDESEVSACGASMTVITSGMTIASWCTRQLINFHNEVELDNEILIDFKYNNIVATIWK